VKLLGKAKRSGKAFIRVANHNCLPTPFDLTNDDRWDTEGEFYKRFDLELGDEPAGNFASSEVYENSYDTPESSNLFDVVDRPNEDSGSSGVKVLSENMASQNKSSNIKYRLKINVDDDALFNEFQQILSPENDGCSPEIGNESKNNNLPPGILTI
jgi:hypothetical protein